MQTITTKARWRTKNFRGNVLLLAAVSLRTLIYAQGTAFTYQGRLNDAGVPANGSYDLQFIVYDNVIGGNQQGPIRTNTALQVNNGLFTTTLDFGGGVFTGPDRWLEISVRASSQMPFTALAPRQQLTAAAYAISAGNLSGSLPASQLAGTIPAAQLPQNVVVNNASGISLSGTFSGDGAGLTGLNASSLSSGTLSDQRLSSNVALQGSENNFSGNQLFHGAIYLNGIDGFDQSSGGNFLIDSANQPGGRLSVLANGNVGIGNPNPASKLDVIGDVAVSGNLNLIGNATLAGNTVVAAPASLSFGNQTRQMLNLWGTAYGVGVERSSLYCRSDFGFIWYQGGSHVPGADYPTGGKTLMQLFSDGSLNIAGGFGSLSDRNAKEGFEPIDPHDVLEKVADLPITGWSYKSAPSVRHLGPMAQDFFTAFHLGNDDKHITTVDEGGVALAAIQGLNQKLEARSQELEGRSRKLEAENAELRQRLGVLEQIVLNHKY
jgi:hypothetical protein